MKNHWKVDVSFYVPRAQAPSAADAERLVEREVNNRSIQKYLGDTVGDADVHEGETVEWDMEG